MDRIQICNPTLSKAEKKQQHKIINKRQNGDFVLNVLTLMDEIADDLGK